MGDDRGHIVRLLGRYSQNSPHEHAAQCWRRAHEGELAYRHHRTKESDLLEILQLVPRDRVSQREHTDN